MNKPTLDDFYREPRKAYINGFRLTWKHSVIHMIKYTFIAAWVGILKLSIEVVADYLIPMLLSLLKIISILLIIITMPIFFPLWVALHQLDLRKTIKKYFGGYDND